MNSHWVFASTAGGDLLHKPMNQPLNGVAEIPPTHVWNLWSWISPVPELVEPWNRRIRVSYMPNYKNAIPDKITYQEGEQFPLRNQMLVWYLKLFHTQILFDNPAECRSFHVNFGGDIEVLHSSPSRWCFFEDSWTLSFWPYQQAVCCAIPVCPEMDLLEVVPVSW